MATRAEGNQVVWIVIVFVVVNMMYWQLASIHALHTAFLACMVITLAYLISEFGAKLFGIANIKSLASLSYMKWDAGLTVDPTIAPVDEAGRLGYRYSTAGTRGGDGIEVSIVRAFADAVLACPLARASLTTKRMLDGVEMPWGTLNGSAALFTWDRRALVGLNAGPMARQVEVLPPTSVIAWKRPTAATRTRNHDNGSAQLVTWLVGKLPLRCWSGANKLATAARAWCCRIFHRLSLCNHLYVVYHNNFKTWLVS